MALNQSEKLHAACDECRTRKLKCSGESPKCTRCTREEIRCIYSPQKQMGRPRKRRREDGGNDSEVAHANNLNANSEHTLAPTTTTTAASLQDSGIGSTSGSEFADFAGLINADDYEGFAGFDVGFQEQMKRNEMESALLGIGNFDGQEFSTFNQEPDLDLNFTPDPTIDPSLWNATPSSTTTTTTISDSTLSTINPTPKTPCSCLPSMYLTISDLQSLSTFSFPAVIPPLRSAVTTAIAIIRCTTCPTDHFSAIQNVQALSSLLSAIAERYHKVISTIDAESEALLLTGTKKPFRIGDNSSELRHLHTGTLDCPMGFDVELEGKDWRRLAKKALRTEILGGGCNATPFKTVLDLFEERQERWHVEHAEDLERKRIFGVQAGECRPGDALCVKMIGHVRRMVENLNWD